MRIQIVLSVAALAIPIAAIPTTKINHDGFAPTLSRRAPAHECLNNPIFGYFMWTGSGNTHTEDKPIITHCDTRVNEGLVVTGIETWYSGGTIKGIKVFYSNEDSSIVYGIQSGTSKKTEWEPTDSVEAMEVWGNGNANWVGRIKIRTRGGVEGEHGKPVEELGKGQTPSNTDISSGILMGLQVAIETKRKNGIRRIGFMWLGSKIDRAEEIDFKFDQSLEELNKKQSNIQTVNLQSTYYVNRRKSANSTFNFINQLKREKVVKTENSKSHSVTASTKISYEATIPLFAKVEAELGLAYAFTNVDLKSVQTSEEVILRWEVSNNIIAPNTAIHCTASAKTGTFNGDYTSTTRVYLEDGKEFEFKTEGTLQSVGWSEAFAECSDFDISKLPSNADVKEV